MQQAHNKEPVDGQNMAITQDNEAKDIKTLLKAVPVDIIQRGYRLLSSLVLPEAPRINIALCGHNICSYGYVMACLEPGYNISVFEEDTKVVDQATKSKKRDNLSFTKEDISLFSEKEKFDAIINMDNLHQLYSKAQYNFSAIDKFLTLQAQALKEKGYLIIDDFVAGEGQEEWIKFQIPQQQKTFIEQFQSFSEQARPLYPQGTRGFYYEEERSPLPGMRIFKCQKKWLSEYLLRFDIENAWTTRLPNEVTAFSKKQIQESLRGKNFSLRFFNLDKADIQNVLVDHGIKFFAGKDKKQSVDFGKALMIFQKKSDGEILNFEEKKRQKIPLENDKIYTVRHQRDDQVKDCLKHTSNKAYILPYVRNEIGNISVLLNSNKHTVSNYLHEYVIQGCYNYMDMDVKMYEVQLDEISKTYENQKPIETIKYLKNTLGLKPILGNCFEKYEERQFHEKYLDFVPQIFLIEIDPATIDGQKKYPLPTLMRGLKEGILSDIILENCLTNLMKEQDGPGQEHRPLHKICDVETVTGQVNKEQIVNQQQIDKLAEKAPSYVMARGRAHDLEAYTASFAGMGNRRGHYIGLRPSEQLFYSHGQYNKEQAYMIPYCIDLSGEILFGFMPAALPFQGSKKTSERVNINFFSRQIDPGASMSSIVKNMTGEEKVTLYKMVSSFWELADSIDDRSSVYLFGVNDTTKLDQNMRFMSLRMLDQMSDACFTHLSLFIKNRLVENFSDQGFKTSINALYQKKKRYKKSKR